MSDAPVAVAPAPASTLKKPKAKKVASPEKASHPTYANMIKAAITALKDRGGSSKQAILKYIVTNYKLTGGAPTINYSLRVALKRGVAGGLFTQPKGIGASGSFRLAEKTAAAKPKKAAAPKAAAKPKSPKKAKAPKKASGEKKAAKPKSPKKAKAPKKASGEKKAAKPKSPKKPKAVKASKPKSPKKAKAPAKPKAAKAKPAAKPKAAKAKPAAPKA